MSADRTSPPSPPVASGRRRSSFAGQFVDLFGRSQATAGNANPPSTFPGPITEAAAQAQRRRLSLTTIGLSGSPNQTSPFTPGRPRTESISSANSGSVDESPFEEGDAPSSSVPATPFGRRLSFGARALRDVRTGSTAAANGNGNPRPSVVSRASQRTPPTAKAVHGRAGQGFDFAENLRSRAERSSVSAASGSPGAGGGGGGGGMPSPPLHHRAKSVATEMPAQAVPKQPRVPDPIQERMLRGDFYMD